MEKKKTGLCRVAAYQYGNSGAKEIEKHPMQLLDRVLALEEDWEGREGNGKSGKEKSTYCALQRGLSKQIGFGG